MVNLVLCVAVAAVISVGFVEVVKNFVPASAGTKVKTVIGIVFEAAVGVGIALVDALFNTSGAVTTTLRAVIVAAGTVGAAQFGYTYIAKLIAAITEKLKK